MRLPVWLKNSQRASLCQTESTECLNMVQEENKNTGETPTNYAVRPHHRQRRLIEYNGRDKMFKVRNTLNILFMILAVVGLILWTQTDLSVLSTAILLVAVVLKIAEVCIRMFKK